MTLTSVSTPTSATAVTTATQQSWMQRHAPVVSLYARDKAIKAFVRGIPDAKLPFPGEPASTTDNERQLLWADAHCSSNPQAIDIAVRIETADEKDGFRILLGCSIFIISILLTLSQNKALFLSGIIGFIAMPALFINLVIKTKRTRKVLSYANGMRWKLDLLVVMHKLRNLCGGQQAPRQLSAICFLLDDRNALDRLSHLSAEDKVALMRLSERVKGVNLAQSALGAELDGDTAEMLHRALAEMQPDDEARERMCSMLPLKF